MRYIFDGLQKEEKYDLKIFLLLNFGSYIFGMIRI
jgi:hypothetical protein